MIRRALTSVRILNAVYKHKVPVEPILGKVCMLVPGELTRDLIDGEFFQTSKWSRIIKEESPYRDIFYNPGENYVHLFRSDQDYECSVGRIIFPLVGTGLLGMSFFASFAYLPFAGIVFVREWWMLVKGDAIFRAASKVCDHIAEIVEVTSIVFP
jgi:hypothetical protein